jgi:gliding motility-associated-like protein
VQEPDKITAQVVITDETCFTSDDGTATAVTNGGTAPFTYDWGTNANNQTTQTATNLATGVYTVLISDANNCNAQATGVVNQPDSLQARLTKVDVACHGDATGLAIASAIGGVGGYTFSWQTDSGIQTGDSAVNLVAGVHAVVTITDANGCQTTDQIIIEQPDAPLAATTASENVDCYGDENGRIKVTTTGGTTPYEYIFENNSPTTTNVFIGLEKGNYDIIIQDANGCTVSQQATITEPNEIIVDLGADILVEAGEQAVLEADITNGVAPFVYVWLPSDSTLSCPSCPTTTVADLLFDKRYDLIITDANGCTGEDFIMVRTKKVKDIFVANAFTPNNDGNNDKLYVQGNPYLAQVKTFRVFDRWGELVYESTDTQANDDTFGWDGTMKDQPMNSGMFVWVAEIEFKDGDVKVYQGSTFLIR